MTANGSGTPSFSEPPDPVHSEGLYSDEVLLQIQGGLLHRMAMAAPLPEGVLERAHLTILLLLSQEGKELSQSGSAGDPESLKGLDAIGRFLGGPAEYFWSIDILMKTLEMTVAFEGEQALKQEALSAQLARANHWAEEDLSSSADFPALRRRLRMHLLAAVRELSMQGSEARALQNVQAARGIGQVLLAQLLEDSLPWMPALLEAERRSSDVKNAKPYLSATNTSREVRKHQDPAAEQEAELLYSTESYVEIPAKNAEMAHCQYLVDCRLEQHWQEALKEILSLSPLLLNPYSRIASAFRKASMRMDLWHHSDGDLLKSVLQIPPETLEGQKDIFRVPGIAGFGLRSAVSAPNTKLLGAALASCALLRNTSWEPCLGPFKVTVSCAMHRPGVLDHFLNSVEMSEFCSIEGHRGCQLEALQTYAKLVLTHLSDVQHRQGVVAPMVQIGVSDSWSPCRTQRYPLAFTETFIEALQSGRPVCMKAWQSPEGSGWRTVPLVKHLMLHYREGGGGRWFSFSEPDPLILYCAIFRSKEEAAFEFQKTGSSRGLFSNSALQRPLSQLDSQILRDYHARDLLNVCRHVVSRALLTGEHEALPSCWRVLHSMAAQLEYLNGVNTTAQAFLLMEELERAELVGSAGVRGSERADSPELGRMISGLCVSLERTLCHSSALAPHSLWEMVERKMLVVSGGGKVQERVGALKVIHVMCQAVMMTTVQDLISLCPEIQAIVQQLQTVEPQENQLVIRNSQPPQWDRGLRACPTTYTALEGW